MIIEKMMRNEKDLDALIKIGKHDKATINEFILWAPKEVIVKRATERGFREDSLLTPQKCEYVWDELNALKAKRLDASIINVETLTPDKVVRHMLDLINAKPAV